MELMSPCICCRPAVPQRAVRKCKGHRRDRVGGITVVLYWSMQVSILPFSISYGNCNFFRNYFWLVHLVCLLVPFAVNVRLYNCAQLPQNNNLHSCPQLKIAEWLLPLPPVIMHCVIQFDLI